MKKISIVIPCFNTARFLRETVESVLTQTFKNIEVVAIDDGSTDESLTILHSFGDRIRVISGPNRGASRSRNIGTASSDGDFIQYVDSDDILPPDAVQSRFSSLMETGADVAYSDWQPLVENPGGEFKMGEVVARDMELFDPDAEMAIVKGFWCPPSALLYRRAIVEKIGGWNERLLVIQDARFLLDAAFHGGRFIRVPEVGAYYRVRLDGSLSRRSRKAFMEDCFENALEIEHRWGGINRLSSKQEKALLEIFFYTARSSYVIDSVLFEKALAELYRLDRNWVPKGPWPLALASKILGYRNAEFVATQFRRLKKLLSFRERSVNEGAPFGVGLGKNEKPI